MIEQTPEYREESIDNAPAYFSELRQEVVRRYELFSQLNIKNIDEYNLKQGNALKRIVIFLDAKSIDRIIYKSDFRGIGLLCVAAGIFFCYYSQSEKINKDLYIYEEANYIEFDRIRNTVLQDSLFCEVVDFATEEKAINAKMLGKRFSLAKNQAAYYMHVLEKLGFIGDEVCYRVLPDQCSKWIETVKPLLFWTNLMLCLRDNINKDTFFTLLSVDKYFHILKSYSGKFVCIDKVHMVFTSSFRNI